MDLTRRVFAYASVRGAVATTLTLVSSHDFRTGKWNRESENEDGTTESEEMTCNQCIGHVKLIHHLHGPSTHLRNTLIALPLLTAVNSVSTSLYYYNPEALENLLDLSKSKLHVAFGSRWGLFEDSENSVIRNGKEITARTQRLRVPSIELIWR